MPGSKSRVARLPGLVDIAQDLGKVLVAAEFTPEGLWRALQPAAVDPADADRLAPDHFEAAVLAHRLASPRLSSLVRLFLAGSTIAHADAADALHPLSVDALVEAGLLTRDGDGVQAAVRISWCDGLLVCHDWQDGRPFDREHVVGVAQASLTLADLTVRRPGVDVLDVGTGGGVQAFLASNHAHSVTGTDINARALDLAAFGAALNGLHTLAWHEGSLLEPVAEETFDLITMNPPFIISPDNTYMWRDTAQSGGVGGLCQSLVGEIAHRLRPDGWASMLAGWLHNADDDWSTPVRSWLTGLGCEAWVLRFSSQDPAGYAHTWLAQTEHTSEGFTSSLDRWLSYYLEHGVEAIATGAIILHRRADGDGHTWADEMPLSPSGPAGEQIQRAFTQRLRLSGLADPGDLLDEVLVPLPGTRLEQTLHRLDGAYHPAPTQLWVHPGMTIGAAVTPVALPVFLELDGERRLRELVKNAVETTGFDADEVEAETLATAVRLVELGLVEWR